MSFTVCIVCLGKELILKFADCLWDILNVEFKKS